KNYNKNTRAGAHSIFVPPRAPPSAESISWNKNKGEKMAKKEFTASEVMVLQKDLQKGIQVIGEQYFGIKQELKDSLGKIENRLDCVENSLDCVENRLDRVENSLDCVENRLDRIEDNLEIIKFSLRQKADLADLEALEKRVIRLEKKFA
ncbi:MAG: hypothetical protein CEN88_249, partial [Candidatus Berkelbacteria bacterium Licking1014_2]